MLAEFRHGWREAGRAVPREKIKDEGGRHHEFVLGRGRLSAGGARDERSRPGHGCPSGPRGSRGEGRGIMGRLAMDGRSRPPLSVEGLGVAWGCVTLACSWRVGYAGKRELGVRRAARMICERPSLAPDYRSGTNFGKAEKNSGTFSVAIDTFCTLA